jgi:hypothetical protein
MRPMKVVRKISAARRKQLLANLQRANAVRLKDDPGRRQRSRVANGKTLLPGIDQRSAWCRRAKELLADHLSDLGGESNTSAAERSIVRRACVLTISLEQLEAKFAVAGEAKPADLDLYQRTAANMRRLLEAVGLQRRAKQIGPSLGELLREDHERQIQQEAPS